MKPNQLRRLVLTAMFAAMTTVATIVIQIPSPMNGYVNLGDCLVLLSAWMFGPWYGAAAAGIGSMLADIITGYAYYAPGTLVIKAMMAVVAGITFRVTAKDTKTTMTKVRQIISGLAAESIMVLGYFFYAGVILQNGIGAAASIPGNLVQGVFGIISATLLSHVLRWTTLVTDF